MRNVPPGADQILSFSAELEVTLIRADGTDRARRFPALFKSLAWWKELWRKLRTSRAIPPALGFAAFMAMYGDWRAWLVAPLFGLVTDDGVDFLSVDMASGLATPRISSMNYHDSGTGSTAAAVTDTGLGTQAGPATRTTGTQSNPATKQYRTVGVISYTSSLSITEWGLFNQAAQGAGSKMWDRRVFSAQPVGIGDALQFSYTLACNSGGT